ncbi:metallophosphoesterase [Sulfurimonas sp. HSL-3221]|uniref:metallophosphoesterase n=1 Tax=Sulfurimonadaceae TaxID=2771471 RepID=UPI001E591351|nr:metallophosphoesterase [Sulfurimonas sp. HSL-3221]UFS61305.1 metallophosphoesterase [Sulfurimonas sp. HSL-3221]
MRFLLFGFVFTAVMGALNLYAYRRFFRRLHFGRAGAWKTVALSLFVVEVLFVFQTLTHLLPDSPLLYYLLSSSVGVTFILFFVALVYDLMHTAAERIPFQPERRRFIKIGFDLTMIIAAVSYLLDGLIGGLRRPMLRFEQIALGETDAKPFRIVQLSDMHIGLDIRREFVESCVTRTNALRPDMVVITGDLVDRKIEHVAAELEPLKALQSRFGTFFITGNHEYFHGVEAIVAHLRNALGITVLDNESVKIAERFNLVGVNDLISKRMGVMPYDVEAAFGDCDPALKTIVLSHQPKSTRIMQHKAYDLMLSGHTHGGQIFPFGLLVMIDQPYLAGHYRVDADKQIYVSRGTGYWGPPLRVLAPSEISVIDIV